MFALLAAGVIAVLISGWLVLDSAAQLADHSRLQTTATEYALTLTRLANKVEVSKSDRSVASLNDDSIARLIAMGDVQTSELTVTTGSGLLKRPEVAELHAGGEAIALQWSLIRNQISALNTEAISIGDENSQFGMNINFIDSLSQSFDAVFTAITNETLSVPLLRTVSEIKAELSNLLFLKGLSSSTQLNDTTNKTLGRLLQNVNALQKQSLSEQGVSLLGYESNILLQSFVEQIAELRPLSSVTASPNRQSFPNEGKAHSPAIQNQIISALDQNEVYRRALDGAIYQYRRSILGALALVCAALLLSAIITWRIWRLKSSPAAQPLVNLNPMIADINALADGNLATEVRSLEGESLQADQSRMIAQAVNYTGKMLHGLVEVSRGVAHKTHTLSTAQRQIAQELKSADLDRQQQLVSMVEGLSQRAIELQNLSDNETQSTNDLAAAALETRKIAKGATSALAGISVQLELSASRVSRAVETVSELASMVDKMKSLAEKSSLQALNTSIQMSAYSDGGDSDVSPQFVDQVQRASRQLEAGASGAGRLLEKMKIDLHASGLAMASCASAIDDSADHSMKASQSFAAVTGGVENMGESNKHLINELKKEAKNLDKLAEQVRQLHGVAAGKKRLPELLETTLDMQLMATNFDNSLSRYKLRGDQSVD